MKGLTPAYPDSKISAKWEYRVLDSGSGKQTIINVRDHQFTIHSLMKRECAASGTSYVDMRVGSQSAKQNKKFFKFLVPLLNPAPKFSGYPKKDHMFDSRPHETRTITQLRLPIDFTRLSPHRFFRTDGSVHNGRIERVLSRKGNVQGPVGIHSSFPPVSVWARACTASPRREAATQEQHSLSTSAQSLPGKIRSNGSLYTYKILHIRFSRGTPRKPKVLYVPNSSHPPPFRSRGDAPRLTRDLWQLLARLSGWRCLKIRAPINLGNRVRVWMGFGFQGLGFRDKRHNRIMGMGQLPPNHSVWPQETLTGLRFLFKLVAPVWNTYLCT